MHVKTNILGLLIYLTMGAYLLAFAVSFFRRPKITWAVYACGFAIAAAAIMLRWVTVGHIPLQNLFEVMLMMGALIFPLSLFADRMLAARGYQFDPLIGAVILFPCGFVFSDQMQLLPPALQFPVFAPHVLVYVVAYVVMAKATLQGFLQMVSYKSPQISAQSERACYNLVRLGFPLLTLGLLLGAYWGKQIWGDYWNWDPKEMWSLGTWLVFVIYFHVRYQYGKSAPKTATLLVFLGMCGIICTLLLVSLAKIFAGRHSYGA
ncbi:MAG: cytochrome c biogenesis protein CcsA [Phycisphaerae bacterium]|nr:cytochrome c biogenesis protein CcsA [Phycisphaerae bacterium]